MYGRGAGTVRQPTGLQKEGNSQVLGSRRAAAITAKVAFPGAGAGNDGGSGEREEEKNTLLGAADGAACWRGRRRALPGTVPSRVGPVLARRAERCSTTDERSDLITHMELT